MILSLFAIVAVVVLISLFIGYMVSAPAYKGSKSGHFNGKTFVNPGNVKQHGLGAVFKWMMNRDQGPWEEIDESQRVVVDNHPGKAVIYFVNHSTLLIQLGDFNILTDPVWSRRVSPFDWVGPKRKRPPGIRFEDLPEIHLVLLSHNHYDHLDISTLKRLNNKSAPLVVAPLGVPAYLSENGLKSLLEMNWWDETKINGDVSIACVPAQHFSGRGMFDRDKTLWAGYVIRSAYGNLYFAGDTGYGEFFGGIAEKYGPVDLAMLPIGAYLPRWFMSPIHISPEEAVRIHLELGARKSIAMHYGTFPLGDDGMWQPVTDLEKAMDEYKINNFYVLDPGGFIRLE